MRFMGARSKAVAVDDADCAGAAAAPVAAAGDRPSPAPAPARTTVQFARQESDTFVGLGLGGALAHAHDRDNCVSARALDAGGGRPGPWRRSESSMTEIPLPGGDPGTGPRTNPGDTYDLSGESASGAAAVP